METAEWANVGALASFTMGSNDVANATGSLVGTGTFSPLTAGLLGGLGLAVGVLPWGRPLLQKVAFDIVTVDRPMATAAQLVQATVVLAVDHAVEHWDQRRALRVQRLGHLRQADPPNIRERVEQLPQRQPRHGVHRC